MSICPICYNKTPPLPKETDPNQDLVFAASRGDLGAVEKLVSQLKKMGRLDEQAIVQAQILAQSGLHYDVDNYLATLSH